MLFNWTDFWIILGVLGTIVVILELCMVGADSSVSVIDQVVHYLQDNKANLRDLKAATGL